ncbi:hypothetical protein CSOJ01_07270 [Colletotrichum sojae]|uniref:Uncharacterized protein n=1 Tax=Colletotrichum sojae TaxID=2175907 RepID=A0A8H6MUL6_9PEZI|nr:hypothetical protein CSOJ01_07270 [Colletotrichum sojae]
MHASMRLHSCPNAEGDQASVPVFVWKRAGKRRFRGVEIGFVRIILTWRSNLELPITIEPPEGSAAQIRKAQCPRG